VHRLLRVPEGRKTIAHGFNRGLASQRYFKPRRGGRNENVLCRPFGTRIISNLYCES